MPAPNYLDRYIGNKTFVDNFVNLVCLNIAKKLFFIQFYAESEPARKGRYARRVQDKKKNLFQYPTTESHGGNRMGRFV